jgi:predicted TIM-barrel fold metal-dependent hydrolase
VNATADLLPGTDVRISADSHVAEPLDLWETRFPAALRDRAPHFNSLPTTSHTRAGGWDPELRIKDMAVDYITAEGLYPSLGGRGLDIEDDVLAEAIATAYNDWLAEFCQYAPDRLWGLAVIPLWNVAYALKELERAKKMGLVGSSIWMAPPASLPFYSPHYERFWSVSEELQMPVSLHINTGFGPFMERPVSGSIEGVAFRAHGHAAVGKEALTQIILAGVLDRHPRLKVIVAEINMGWVPFWLQELDENTQRYAHRASGSAMNDIAKLDMLPSEYYARQCYSTFMDDTVGAYQVARWWHHTAMWSTDYPHWNGIWPKGTEVLNRTLTPLSPEQRYDVVCGNVARLYNKPVPPPLPHSDYVPAKEEWPARLQREHARNI